MFWIWRHYEKNLGPNMVNLTAFLRAVQNHNQATKILRRTFEVKTVKETRSLVKKWTKYEVSIAVDIESHNNGKPGLITVKDFSKNIYFIRTGLDHNLTTELRDVFENSKVTKIMHGAGNDIHCLSQSRIQIKNVCDVQYKHGLIHPANHSLTLNKLCSHHGLSGNPYKSKSRKTKWYFESDTLPENIQLYCAYDVECLEELHESILLQKLDKARKTKKTKVSKQVTNTKNLKKVKKPETASF